MTTIVITTTEQAQAYLKILEAERKAAKNLDRERQKPIRWMTCTCCGESYRGRQWWNQDEGYGLGDCCVDICHKAVGDESDDTYGIEGIHYRLEK